jgi:hypothetical protein
MITLCIILLAIPVILIIALFTRKGFTVAREININQPIATVFNYSAVLKNQDLYHRQLMIDAGMKKEFGGTDGQPGSYYLWESRNPKVGKASQKIVRITEPTLIEIAVTFEKPFHSKAILLIEPAPVNASETKVKWTFQGNEHPYYLLRVGHLLFRVKKAVTKNLEESLSNLKTKLEQ